MIAFTDEVESVFSYSEAEQNNFPFLAYYMKRIKPILPRILADPKARERFMLAGLFLPYIAFNHLGSDMSTEVDRASLGVKEIHIDRLYAFKRFTGKSVYGQGHYLQLTGFRLRKIFVIYMGNMLYQYVWRGWTSL